MATFHISVADAVRDFPGLLARVRAGADIVIDDGASPAVVLRAAQERPRLLSESLRILEERGSTVTLDGDFGRDLEAIIAGHSEALKDPWA